MKFNFRKKKKEAPKTKSKEWLDAIVFAVIAATLIRWAFLEAFTIPTQSMEKSLLVGDYLFVSKVHYGTRTPKTPLQLPLTHQTIWGTNIPSYLDWIQLPQYRLPGFTSVKNNDVVVFNYPPDDYPTDLKTNYIKRCLAIAGDTFEIRNQEVLINGTPVEDPPQTQFSYYVEPHGRPLFTRFRTLLRKYNVTDFDAAPDGYRIWTTPETAKQFEAEEYIKRVTPLMQRPHEGDASIFPHDARFMWNQDNMGPLWIPAKGATISMTPENVVLYGHTIVNFEHLDNASVTNDQLFIDSEPVMEYTFTQDYYFMVGDNRHNSLDSRYWGFVPEDHIVGKAALLWLSIDPDPDSFINRVRWNRIFNIIR
ncbi:signal peptidase I [Cytophagaceae bacterium ABcell3]|nr:signal peptidase I [Cytophagaceae bacterium ABcell3]